MIENRGSHKVSFSNIRIASVYGECGPFFYTAVDIVKDALFMDVHKQRVLDYIDSGIKEGAALAVDGRNPDVREGYFVGATIFDHVTPEMKIWQDEIFAPVLSVVRVQDLDEGMFPAKEKNAIGAGTLTLTPIIPASILSRNCWALFPLDV